MGRLRALLGALALSALAVGAPAVAVPIQASVIPGGTPVERAPRPGPSILYAPPARASQFGHGGGHAYRWNSYTSMKDSGAGPASTASAGQPLRCANPTDTRFKRVAPREVGLDASTLQDAIDFAHTRGFESVRVHRFGCLAAMGRVDEEIQDVPRNYWSYTKSQVAVLMARAQTLGYLRIDEPIGKYLPVGMGDEAHRRITFRALMEMASGIHQHFYAVWGGRFPTSTLTVDQVREALATPIDYEPRTHFVYNDLPLTLMLYTAERAIGSDIQDFAQKELFGPLGIRRESWYWFRDRAGHTEATHQFFGTHANFWVIGQLLLQNGEWRGQQLIAPQYVQEIRTPSPRNPAYGLLTWLNTDRPWTDAGALFAHARTQRRPLIASAPMDMFYGYGYGGMMSFVIPSLQMVVTTAANRDIQLQPDPEAHVEQGEFYHEFFRKLMRAVQDVHIPDPGPWSNPQEPHNLQPEKLSNPDDATRTLDLPPGAAAGCNPLGCDGEVYYEGTVRTPPEIVASYSASSPRTANDVTPAARREDDSREISPPPRCRALR
jgi:CubicO group peptidase (beta-lactamase class C family)